MKNTSKLRKNCNAQPKKRINLAKKAVKHKLVICLVEFWVFSFISPLNDEESKSKFCYRVGPILLGNTGLG